MSLCDITGKIEIKVTGGKLIIMEEFDFSKNKIAR